MPTERSPMPVPPLLRDAAAWSWRVLVIAVAIVALGRLAARLYLVTLPFVAGLLATALLFPVTAWLRRRGLPRGLAAGATLLAAFLVLGTIAFVVVDRAVAEYPTLVDKVQVLVNDTRDFLVNGPLHLRATQVEDWRNTAIKELQGHSNTVAQGVITGVGVFSEFLAGAILALFVTFFMLFEGDRIWDWVMRLFPARRRADVHQAGLRAWDRLSGFVRGTFVIAVFHAMVIAVTLAILGVPLVAPLSLLVFVGSFIPIVGVVIAGALAVLVSAVSNGLVAGVIVLAVLLVANQIESHGLQPFLVGRYVRLHPLVVAMALTAGALIAGIVGAILAVPFTAVVYAVVDYFATARAAPEDGAVLTDEERAASRDGGPVTDPVPEPAAEAGVGDASGPT